MRNPKIHKSRILDIFKGASKELKAMTVGDMLEQFDKDVKKENGEILDMKVLRTTFV